MIQADHEARFFEVMADLKYSEEAFGDMYEALKTCLDTLDANRAYILADSAMAEAQQALAKAEGHSLTRSG